MVVYRFDPLQKLLTVTLSGVVDDADFADEGFPDIPVGTREILDMSAATRAAVSGAEIRRVAERDQAWPNRVTQMAIVAPTEVAFGLARMYQTLADGMKTEVKVFRDVAEARAWLDID